MTGAASIALALAFVAAVIDWRAVLNHDIDVESFAKPLVMVALAITTLLLDLEADIRIPLLVALACSLLGDVFLLPSIDRFMAGLAAFLAAHLAYAFVFWGLGVSANRALASTLLLGVLAAGVVRRFRSVPVFAVSLYVAVLVAMASLAIGTGHVVALSGALLFVASDAVLGWNRFAAELPHGRLITHVLYHVGQALIVVGVAGS